ncbi:MAG TPA: GH1 family beta-glucosidase [Kiritimatiellia bacterium]|nr:GH1 family beta-glucosidase [Kiritimatiellia bacterium]
MTTRHLPALFEFGAATSAFQIEGALTLDGRGESIWDCFCRKPGTIADGSTAELACDHYRRMPEDIAIMKDMGLTAYRFSISWPRIFPNGRGKIESRGLDFYQRMTDLLLDADIKPFITLHHWDLPQAIQDRGGWADRDCVDDFCIFAEAVTQRLGDRVKHWITINEPWCIASLGYRQGVHAPGIRDPRTSLAVAHHVLLAHGRAVPIVRANSPECDVGIALNLTPGYAATQKPQDQYAANIHDGTFNRWYLDPLYFGKYPEDIVTYYQTCGDLPPGDFPFVRQNDMKEISAPMDFLGVNYYTRAICRDQHTDNREGRQPGHETEMGWEVYPDGLFDLLVRLNREYRIPGIYISENGCSYSDGPGITGAINDQRRIDYLDQHLQQCRKAITEGVPLSGYFVWSLLDNFEWQFGYRQRFGLVWVDYFNGRRTLKASAHWYREQIISSRRTATEIHA